MTTVIEPTRRHLTARQAELVDRLIEAAGVEATERGYEGMTVRSAAKRAEVAPATAYTYFASKDHLLAEVLWRRIENLPPVDTDSSHSALERVTTELGHLGTFMAEEPALAAACTTALLAVGTDVRVIRDRFGSRIVSRIGLALGDRQAYQSPSYEQVLRTLNLALIGAMLSAGMGNLSFDEVPAAMAETAALVIGGGK